MDPSLDVGVPTDHGKRALPDWFVPWLGGILFAAYAAFILGPIAALIGSGWAFAGDPAEYLLTAHRGFGSGPGELPYVFPTLPLVYRPFEAIGLSFGRMYAMADLATGVVAILLTIAFGVLGYVLGKGPVAALAAAASAGTFPAILGEIGWGGQAQMLSVTLGVLAVAVLLYRAPALPSWRSGLAAGLLLGLAALTEPYAAACLTLFAAFTVLLFAGRSGLRPAVLLRYASFVAPPIGGAAFVSWFAGAASPKGLGAPVIVYAIQTNSPGFLVTAVGFADVWTVVGYLLVLGAVAVMLVFGPGLERRALAAFGGAALAFVAQVFLVTPATYWPRAATFFVLPLAIATAALVPALFRRMAPARAELSSRPRSWVARRPRADRWLRRVSAGAAIALVVAQVVVAYGAYPGGLQFNEFDSNSVGGLSFLRSADGAVVLVAPEALTFPIAYATERPLYPAVQPFWFDTAEERSAAVFASTVASGAAWIDSGSLELVEDGAPSGPSSPSLYVYQSAYLIPVGTVVEEEGGSFAQTYAARGPGPNLAGPTAPASGASLTGQTQLPSYQVSTVSSITAGGAVMVNFTFRSAAHPAPSVGVGLTFPQIGLEDARLAGGVASLVGTFQEPGGTAVDLPLQVSVLANSSVDVGPPTINGSAYGPVLLWNLSAPGDPQFNVSIVVDLPSLMPSPPALIQEAAALGDYDVHWVVVDSATNASSLPRFDSDPLFASVRWSGPFEVFEVL